MAGTYTLPTSDGEGFGIVTESNKGARAWVLSHVSGVPESDHEVYRFTASVTWPDDVDPQEVGLDGGDWDSPYEPTEAVENQLRSTRTVAFFEDLYGNVSLHGVRKDEDKLDILYRALKYSNDLM